VTPPPQPKIDVVLERLDNLKSGQQDMATNIANLSCDFRTSQLNYVREHEELSKDAEHTMKRVNTLEGEIEELKPLLPTTESNSKRLDKNDEVLEEIKKTHGDYIIEIDKKILKVTTALEKIQPWIAGVKWLALTLGGLIVIGAVGLLTHQITIAFH
jgi:chromosome segregation ATPase